jgi:hypothetical protein
VGRVAQSQGTLGKFKENEEKVFFSALGKIKKIKFAFENY